MSLTLRPAIADDAAAIRRIYAPVVTETAISFEYEPPDVAEIRARIAKVQADGYPWLVALTSSGDIGGYAYATAFRARTAYAWTTEVSVYVDAAARGTGVGRTLYDALLRTLAAQGFCSAYGVSTAPNPASEALHRAAGFQLIARLPRVGWKFERWHDALVWQRALAREGAPPKRLESVASVWPTIAASAE